MTSENGGDPTKNLQFWPVELRLDKFEPASPAKILCFRLLRGYYAANSQMICTLKPAHGNQDKVIESLFLFFLEMLQRMDKEVREVDAYRQHRQQQENLSRPWMTTYMEVVPAQHSEERAIELEQAMKRVIETLPGIDKKLIFWAPGTPVAEVRFWVLIESDIYTLSSVVEKMLKETNDKREKFESDPTLAKRSIASRSSVSVSNFKSASAVTLDSHEHQHWRKIAKITELLDAVSLYVQDNDIRTNPKWASMPISSPESPANPITSYNMLSPFFKISSDCPPVEDCIKIKNYFTMEPPTQVSVMRYNPLTKVVDSQTETRCKFQFTFPHPEYVIGPLALDEIKPEAMDKFTPWHQFDHLYEDYWRLFTISKPVTKLLIPRRRLPRNRAVRPADRNENDNDLADEEEEEPDDPMEEEAEGDGALLDPSVSDPTDTNNTLASWSDLCSRFGLGTAGLSSTAEMRTHRLETRDLRDARQMLGENNGFSEGFDPLAQMRRHCIATWHRTQKEVKRRSEIVWQKIAAEQPLEGDDEVYGEFETAEQVHEAMMRNAYTGYQRTAATHFASHIHEEAKLQHADSYFASFCSKFVGTVLSKEVKFKLAVFDENLSMFAHKAVWLMEQFEQNELVANAHIYLFKMYFGRLSCLCKNHNMKYNVIWEGPPMLSKSFGVEVVKEHSVPGTCVEFQQKSAKSNYVQGHRDGLIMVNHELPGSIMQTGNSKFRADDQEVAILKDILTSGTSRYIVYGEGAGGQRQNHFIMTSHIQCHFYLTNHPIKDIDPALFSRFDHFVATPMSTEMRRNKTLSALAMAKGNAPTAVKRNLAHFHQIGQMTQCMCWMVEQLIAAEAINEPTLFCTKALITEISETLRKKDMEEIHPRVRERILIIARSIVIVMGIMYLYFVPGAPYFQKPFYVNQLTEINPLLVDTEEIAIFVLGLFSDTIDNPYRSAVMRALVMIFRQSQSQSNKAVDSFRYGIKGNIAVSTTDSRYHNNHSTARYTNPVLNEIPAGNTSYYDSLIDDDTTHAAAAGANGASDGEPADEAARERAAEEAAIHVAQIVEAQRYTLDKLHPDDEAKVNYRTYDLNYVAFDKGYYGMANLIAGLMAANEQMFPQKMSSNQIQDQLKQMAAKSQMMTSYELPPGKDIKDVLCGKVKPAPAPANSATLIECRDGKMYVHYHIMQTTMNCMDMHTSGVLEEAIIASQHKYTRKQKIIYGATEPNSPFAFRTMMLKPNPARTLEILNPFFQTKYTGLILARSCQVDDEEEDEDNAREQDTSTQLLNHDEYKLLLECSVELECMRRRMAELHVPISDPELLEQYSINTRDRKVVAAEKAKNGTKYMFNYPTDMINELKKRIMEGERTAARRPAKRTRRGEQQELSKLFSGISSNAPSL